MDAPRPDFTLAFSGPRRWRDADGEITHTRVDDLGALAFPSGRIAVGDPLVGMMPTISDDGTRSTDLAPPGGLPTTPCPVSACVARFDNGDERVVALRVRFADAPAVRWDDADGGASVDSGTAAFCDAADVDRFVDHEGFGEPLLERVLAWQQAGTPTWFATVTDHAGVGLAICASGFGDGMYSALWGRSATGDPVELVLDFDVLITQDIVWMPVVRPAWGAVRAPELDAAGVSAWVPFWKRQQLVIRDAPRAVARWRGPDGVCHRMKAEPDRARKQWTYDLSAPPPDTELVIGLVRGHVPMTPLD